LKSPAVTAGLLCGKQEKNVLKFSQKKEAYAIAFFSEVLRDKGY